MIISAKLWRWSCLLPSRIAHAQGLQAFVHEGYRVHGAQPVRNKT